MATPDARRGARIVAFNAANVQHLKTVNVLSSAPLDPHHSIKEYLQLTAALARVQHNPTFMASGAPGAVTKGLPTIYINGYSAPS
jgi:hypothetical protein